MKNNEPTQLAIDLAAVCGFSKGNRDKVSNATKQAKQALGIDIKKQKLTDDEQAAIVQWHIEQRKQTNDNQQVDIEVIAPPVALRNDNATIEQVETIAPDTAINENAPLSEVELLRIENATLQARLELIDRKAAPDYDFNQTVRIAFYMGDKRAVIALSGFYLNALMLAAGIDKKSIPAWIKAAVDSWGAFDDKLNVTEQVKLLIIRELEEQLIRARSR
jgi:hypothetical protein